MKTLEQQIKELGAPCGRRSECGEWHGVCPEALIPFIKQWVLEMVGEDENDREKLYNTDGGGITNINYLRASRNELRNALRQRIEESVK